LSINQSMDINITGSVDSSENKRLDIYMVSDAGSLDETQSEVLLLGNIDLPVFYNTNTQLPNPAYLWKDFKFEIDFDEQIYLDSSNKLKNTT